MHCHSRTLSLPTIVDLTIAPPRRSTKGRLGIRKRRCEAQRATFRIAVVALVTLVSSPAYAQLFLTAGGSIHFGGSRYEITTGSGQREGFRLEPSGLGLLSNLEYGYGYRNTNSLLGRMMGIGVGTELITYSMGQFGRAVVDCQAFYGMVSLVLWPISMDLKLGYVPFGYSGGDTSAARGVYAGVNFVRFMFSRYVFIVGSKVRTFHPKGADSFKAAAALDFSFGVSFL